MYEKKLLKSTKDNFVVVDVYLFSICCGYSFFVFIYFVFYVFFFVFVFIGKFVDFQFFSLHLSGQLESNWYFSSTMNQKWTKWNIKKTDQIKIVDVNMESFSLRS